MATDATVLSDGSVAELRQALSGTVITPADPDYEGARRVWNGVIDRRPALIARCAGAADVVEAVRFARSERLLTAVRGGGHNVAGHGTCDDGIVIDLSPMRAVEVDAQRRLARVQGGALWSDVDQATQAAGLGVTGGLISHTGVAGLTLGGGIGWLHAQARAHLRQPARGRARDRGRHADPRERGRAPRAALGAARRRRQLRRRDVVRVPAAARRHSRSDGFRRSGMFHGENFVAARPSCSCGCRMVGLRSRRPSARRFAASLASQAAARATSPALRRSGSARSQPRWRTPQLEVLESRQSSTRATPRESSP